jgi:putative ABC transport system permease protein
MFNDLKYALRLLLKSPGFSALLLIVMTFGLAISLYMFSFVHNLAFKPLPFDGGDKIVTIGKLVDKTRFGGSLLDVDVVELLEQSQSFSDSGLVGSYRANLTINEKTYAHYASSIEPSVLDVTNISPFLGRAFNDKDAMDGAPLVALISYELWQRYYPNKKQALGTLIEVNQVQATIVGVMAPGYSFPGYTDLWLPIKRALLIRGDDERWYHSAVAKIKDNVSIAAANDDVKAIMKKLAVQYPKTTYGVSAYIETFQKEYIGPDLMMGMWVLIFCAVFLLLLTILNVSALLLSKSIEYSRETAMRRALGAPKLRLLMQITWPSLIITTLSAGLALLISAWALELTNLYFDNFDFGGAPYWIDFKLAPFNFYISAVVIALIVLVSGVLPGIKASGDHFNQLLKESNAGATNYYVTKVSRHLLKAEVALSAFILTIACLLVVNIQHSSQAKEQYISDNMLTSMLSLPLPEYTDYQQREGYINALKAKILTQPAVEKVAFTSSLPGSGAWVSMVHARDVTLTGEPIYANSAYIDEDLLALTKIPLLAGRYFTKRDDHNQPLVAIISKSLAQTLWASDQAIGKTIVLDDFENSPEALIVGLVDDVHHGFSFGDFAALGGVYVPIKQYNFNYYQFVVSYQGTESKVLEHIEKQMVEVDPDVPLFFSMSYQKLLAVYSSGIKFSSQLFTLLGLISLLLAAAGIYGVTANSVNQKRRDIATRRSLGATNMQIFTFFLRTTMWTQFAALVFGSVAATLFCYWKLDSFILSLSSMLLNMFSVFLVLFIVILCALLIPLWKALKHPPAFYLRND